MNQNYRPPSTSWQQYLPRYEIVVTLLILIFPIGGVFYPPETYFAPQDFTIEGVAAKEIGFPFARLANIAILGWIFFLFYKHQRMMATAMRRCLLPLAFVGWAMVSAFFTADPMGSINRGVRMLIAVALAAYLVECFGTRMLLRYFLLAGAVAIAASLFAVIVIPSYGQSTLMGYETAWRGAMNHKNTFGAAMALLVAQSYVALRAKCVSKRFGRFMLYGSIFMLIMSQSRTAQATVVVNFCVLFTLSFINRFRSTQERAFALSLTSLLIPIGLVVQANFDEILIALGRNPTLTGRTDVWGVVWEQIQANPIWGYGNNFWATESPLRNYMWLQLNWAAPHAHNMYLDVWFQLGLVGLVLASIIFALVMFRSLTLILLGMPFVELIWPASIIVVLFQGFSETNLVEPAGSGWFPMTLAFASLSKAIEVRTRLVRRRRTVQEEPQTALGQ